LITFYQFLSKKWSFFKKLEANGARASSGNLIENDQEGEWQYFNKNGELAETKIFSNGDLIKSEVRFGNV
jgi:antitoxin component YwqK of YwqJK toxin-antitoxin module